jgi:hypothetical protein
MNIKTSIIFVFLFVIKLNTGIPSNSYYLIDIDINSSLNISYCSNKLIEKNLYRIPNQCHNHLLCNAYHCDDKSFRCIKIRETLCCVYKYLQKSCSNEKILKDQFRSIYFHISIQHGYCEINLERIEQIDPSYCLAEIPTTTSQSRPSFKYIHRYRHHLTTPSTNISDSPMNISSKSSFSSVLSILIFFCLISIC